MAQFIHARLAVQDTLEGGPGHLGVGLTGRGVLTDVGRDAVEGVEGHLPTPPARAAGVDEGLVDVEEHDDGLGHLGHVAPASSFGVRAIFYYPTWRNLVTARGTRTISSPAHQARA